MSEKFSNGTKNPKQNDSNHEYFFQIQGRMMVSGATFCEFVVFTKKDFFVQNIKEDLMFQNEMFEMLANFYLKHGAELVKALRI